MSSHLTVFQATGPRHTSSSHANDGGGFVSAMHVDALRSGELPREVGQVSAQRELCPTRRSQMRRVEGSARDKLTQFYLDPKSI